MIVDLEHTTTKDVSKKLVSLRHDVGAMAMGRVLTLLVSVDEAISDEAIAAANNATRQHPARIVVLVRTTDTQNRLDAQIRVGGDAGASEIVILRLSGELAEHGGAVVTPLLLPDSPIVTWWPSSPPENVAESPLGQIATRRITDAATALQVRHDLSLRCANYSPGDTDLTWTRITRWRALLAASLDYPPFEPVDQIVVAAEADCASADLLGAWLAQSLNAPVRRQITDPGTGLAFVGLNRASGPIELRRTQGPSATLSQPQQPERQVALLEPDLSQALADELRRLDPDEVYAASLCDGLHRVFHAGPQAPDAASSSPAESNTTMTDHPQRSAVDTAQFSTWSAKKDVADAAAAAAVQRLRTAVDKRGVAHLGLTGGSLGIEVVRSITEQAAGDPVWASVHLWWGDERFLPRGHSDRNDQQAFDVGLLRWGVPSEQIHSVASGSDIADLPVAAANYATALAAAADPNMDQAGTAAPAMDVLFLGVGPDSHIASLFPGREEVLITDSATVAVVGSPKPPPLRVSLTVPVIQRAKAVWLIVGGQDKAAAVAASILSQDQPSHPASFARGTQETRWWLDTEAASLMPN